MSNKKQGGLGKGLDALFGMSPINEEVEEKENNNELVINSENEKTSGQIKILKIVDVEPNKEQPRKHFDEDALIELANSIREYGVLQPIVVNQKNGYYEIVAGERRWRASKLAGLKEIPAMIKNIDEKTSKEIALIENVQREDLNAIEKALGYKSLMEEYDLTVDELVEKVRKSKSAISNTIRILSLDERVIEFIKEGKLTEGHCRGLVAIKDRDEQYEVAKYIIETGGSVRDAENLFRKRKQGKAKKSSVKLYDAVYRDIESKFRNFFGTKVKLDPKNEKQGKIIIEYKNNDELERLIESLKK